ncbi:hypothetical protein NAB30_17545, partial [Proteus mirabilis]|nr:hypothetical protein [Proteus mirabilis]
MTDSQAHPDLEQSEDFEPEWPAETPEELGIGTLIGCTLAHADQFPAAQVLRDSFLRHHPGALQVQARGVELGGARLDCGEATVAHADAAGRLPVRADQAAGAEHDVERPGGWFGQREYLLGHLFNKMLNRLASRVKGERPARVTTRGRGNRTACPFRDAKYTYRHTKRSRIARAWSRGAPGWIP